MGLDLNQALETLIRAKGLLEPVLDSYERSLAAYGADPRSAYWKDADRQVQRYQILSRLFDKADRNGGITVTDFGCGYGALFDFLKDRPVMTGSRYVGVDISAKMIDEAKRRIADPRATFIRHMILTEDTDYTFVCGTYNMSMDADPGDWAAYVRASLTQLWSRTRKALGFNMLRSDAVEQYPSLYYAEPQAFLDYCREALSPNVELFDNRPLPDWTIFIRRARDGQPDPGQP